MNWNQTLFWSEIAASLFYSVVLIIAIVRRHRRFDPISLLGACFVGAIIPAGIALMACGFCPSLFLSFNDSIIRTAVVLSGVGLVVLAIFVFRTYVKGERFQILKSLDSVGQETGSFEVIHAVYGVDGAFKDVTQQLKQRSTTTGLSARVSNELAGVDPIPNVRKLLRLVYRFEGRVRTMEYWEDSDFDLPPEAARKSKV